MYRRKSKKKKKFFEKMQKKFQSALLDPPGRYTGNNFLFKGGLTIIAIRYREIPMHTVLEECTNENLISNTAGGIGDDYSPIRTSTTGLPVPADI